MRKRLKNKSRSCAMCKPHKRKWASRWKPSDLDSIVRFEREIKGHMEQAIVSTNGHRHE